MPSTPLTVSTIIDRLKEILPFETGTNIYDSQLTLLVKGAISKLASEGLPIDVQHKSGDYWFTEDSNEGHDYTICVSYQIMKDMDFDVDTNYLTEQYITRIGTLRLRLGRDRA